MERKRLDVVLTSMGLGLTRSQAESYIRLGSVTVNGKVVQKPGYWVVSSDKISFNAKEQYVSRAGLKLASIAKTFDLKFQNSVVLDVGSSTGGFTDYAMQHGAAYVIAVDVGTNQLHPSLRTNARIELHEQTDIRNMKHLSRVPDYVVIDVSFVSLQDILPSITKLIGTQTKIIAMVKPQFEARHGELRHRGVIKNEKVRRDILKDFEFWAKNYFKLINKADSQVAGEKGNRERFYLLAALKK